MDAIDLRSEDFETQLSRIDLDNLQSEVLSAREIRRRLENLAMSADAKSTLDSLMRKVVRIGGVIVYVGRAILTFAFDVIKISPGMVFGAVLACVVSSLIAAVPLLGGLLGAILAPLLLAFGIGAGAVGDLLSGRAGQELARFVDRYRPLMACY